MERTKYIFFALLLMGLLSSSTPSRQAKVYQAYISNTMNQWQTVLNSMQNKQDPDLNFRMEMLNYQYGYVAYLLGKKKNDDARKYLEKAWKNLEFLEKKKHQLSTLYAYRSAFYGYEIGLNSLKAPYYGPKSMRYAKKAMEKDKSDPMGFIQYANIQFYMPSAFGGSKKEAADYYKKAILKMEAKRNWLNNWNYLSLLATYGQALEALEKYEEAIKVYEKALRVEADFLWIKKDLLPKLKKKSQHGN